MLPIVSHYRMHKNNNYAPSSGSPLLRFGVVILRAKVRSLKFGNAGNIARRWQNPRLRAAALRRPWSSARDMHMRHGQPDSRRAWPVHLGMKVFSQLHPWLLRANRYPQRPHRLINFLSAGMNPRKKVKPNTEALVDATTPGSKLPPDASTTNTPSGTPSGSQLLQDAPVDKSVAASAASVDTATPTTSGTQTPRGNKWLSGTGSWRLKAPAIVRTATESIGVTGGATGELPAKEAKKPRDESPKKFLTKRKTSKGDAIPAAITTVNVSSGGLMDEPETPKPKDTEEPPTPKMDEPPLPPEPPKSQVDAAASTWGWRSWWSRPDGYADTGKVKVEAQSSVEEASTTPLPGPTPSEEPDAQTKSLHVGMVPPKPDQNPDTEMKDAPPDPMFGQDAEMKDVPPTTAKHTAKAASGSWFWSWSSAQNAQANPPPVEPPVSENNLPKPDAVPKAAPEAAPAAAPAATSESVPTPEATAPAEPNGPTENTQANPTPSASSKPSAWAFWYRGKPGDQKNPSEAGPQKHVGEVAVFDTPSQSHPEAAQFNEQEQPKTDADVPKEPLPPPKEETVLKKSFGSLRGRPKPKTPAKGTPADTPSSSKTVTPTKNSPVLAPTKIDTAPAAQPAPKQDSKAKQGPANLVLPEFKNTYQMVHQPNFWQQVRRYFLGSECATPHLHINPAPPKIRKAVAIGVHGFFPAPILQKVLGQPTGTSIRFANAAAAAIKDWSEARGYSPEIEQIALEGEGFIAERVNSLWKLLLNWIDHIKQADFILVACHSQGVPVAMMLVAKLIQFGCVNATRIGVCAMAGVNMGPFIEYKTRYLGPTAAELFEFSNPKSLVSQMYLAALDEVLRFGVRIVYVGSIDDQLVSLEVSFSNLRKHTRSCTNITPPSPPLSPPSPTPTFTAPSS